MLKGSNTLHAPVTEHLERKNQTLNHRGKSKVMFISFMLQLLHKSSSSIRVKTTEYVLKEEEEEESSPCILARGGNQCQMCGKFPAATNVEAKHLTEQLCSLEALICV